MSKYFRPKYTITTGLLLIVVLFCICFFILTSHSAVKINPDPWLPLTDGVSYRIVTPYQTMFAGRLYAFKIKLNKYKLVTALMNKEPYRLNNIEKLTLTQQATLGVNGGFFNANLQPLGLRYNQNNLLSPIKYVSWWPIFAIRRGKAQILTPNQFKTLANVEFAIQAGPRLLKNGFIPKLKPGHANRTALGITVDGDIIVVATANLPLTTFELATLMRDTLQCRDAINLDGGSSTQLYANIGQKTFSISNITAVSDAILVLPR